MKKKLLIATHSVFADGIKNAMELVTGEQNSVSTLCAYTNDMTEVETPIKEIIDALCDDEELIVTTDIFGGSVNNEFMKYLSKSNIYLIAGVNLPLLFELIMNLESENTVRMIETAVKNARKQLQYCNPLIQCSIIEENF